MPDRMAFRREFTCRFEMLDGTVAIVESIAAQSREFFVKREVGVVVSDTEALREKLAQCFPITAAVEQPFAQRDTGKDAFEEMLGPLIMSKLAPTRQGEGWQEEAAVGS